MIKWVNKSLEEFLHNINTQYILNITVTAIIIF